ncbi:hypothetical protein QTP88_012214 [Uroleucon formosanum]
MTVLFERVLCRHTSQKWFMPSLLGRTSNSIQVITELDTVTKRKYHARAFPNISSLHNGHFTIRCLANTQ